MTAIRIVGICYKPETTENTVTDHFVRVSLESAELVVGHGIRGDRKGGHPERQLNIMSSESLHVLAADGFDVSLGSLGEQMVIQGIDVRDLPERTQLQLGAQARVEIVRLRNGCERLAKYQNKLPQHYEGRLGVMVKVVQGGIVKVGDSVEVIAASPVNGYTFVSTLWLEQHLTDKNLRIVDIRGRVAPATDPLPHYFSHRADYEAAHLPGAVFVDWVKDITVDGDHHMQIAPPEKFAALMDKLGIGADTMVAVYDDAGGMFAARLWWALNYYGHTQVAVLDGGWQKWIAEGRATTADAPKITKPKSPFHPRINPQLRKTANEVQAALDQDIKLIDVRTIDEYMGKASRAKRAGHIPGAINLPRSALNTQDSTMQPTDVVQDLLLSLDIQPDDTVITYCNGGVSASYGLLALRQAGYTNVAVYDGSWKEWGNDNTRPIE